MSDTVKIISIDSANQEFVANARQLFKEYEASIGVSLCFQNFEDELATLPGKYSPPWGRLLLAYIDELLVGCIALRKIDEETCEMKRLFLRSSVRGKGLGRRLVDEVISEARSIGYRRMRLDTMPGRMKSAIALYYAVGFREIEPYYDTPVGDTKFMELEL
jgi:GNAT superfamily N-acetyltransferase